MRRFRPSSMHRIVLAGALTVGLGVGIWMATMAGQGQVSRAVLIVLGLFALVGSLLSTEVALGCLFLVAFTDGIIKGIDPTKWSVVAKDVFLLIALFRWGWISLQGRQSAALRLPIVVPAVLLTLYAFAEMFNTATASPLVALAGFRTWVVWIPLAFITYDLVRRREQMERLVLYLVVLGLLTGVYGIVQYRIGFGHLAALGPGFDFYDRFAWGSGVRATSSFVAPGAFGSAMAVVAILAAAGVVFLRGIPLKVLCVVACTSCLVGLATSGSRTPLLGLLVGLVMVLVLVRRPQVVVGAVVLGLLFLWQMNEVASGAFERRYNPEMLNSRVVLSRAWGPLEAGLRGALAHPFGVGVATGAGVGRGVGLMEGEDVRVSRTAAIFVENEYGRALYELGIPGIVLFMWLLIRVLRGSMDAYRRCRTNPYRLMAGAGVGILVTVLTQLMVGSALYLAPGGLIFWCFYALTSKLPVLEAAEFAAAAQPAPAVALQPAAGGAQ